ncbi:MAG: type II toxin-antitoxin system VapC family toxin [Acidobacteriota bacterium]|nr:type II toxin-antitoxin system VapC family toxin [Acidobacteriota bacterium]
MNLVIDASVSAKWFFSETNSGDARELLKACERGEVEFLAPEVLVAEMANLIWKKVLQRSVDGRYGAAFLDRFRQIPITLQPTLPLSAAAFELAVQFRHPVYDCLYVVLAVKERCDFVTADRRLFRALNPVLSCVRLLGEAPLENVTPC